jgi:hypothetical protein
MNIRKGFFRFTLVLSILVGTIPPLCHEWFFDKGEVDIDLPENWRRMSIQDKLNSLDGLLSKKAPFFLLSEIKQFNIRRQLRKMIVDKEDGVLRDGFKYRFSFRFYVGWEELGLLGGLGFASVWMIYACVRMVTPLIPYKPMIHFPSLPLRERVESLHFPMGCETGGLASVKITLFFFLALEERPKRPEKPRAVWID